MTYLIGEIGINHNGSLDIAFELIRHAKEAGFDAVKFQKRTIDIVYKKEFLDSYRDSPWGSTQRDQKQALEFSLKDYDRIDEFCKSISIEWFVSSWDQQSQIEMRRFDFNHNKVASALATNVDFLRCVASEGRHTFISTGMMDLPLIDIAVEIFERCKCPYTIMHTVSTYPCKEEDINLNCIKTLIQRYNCPVGYSGHEVSVTPSVIAVVLGATAIERHITLDRAMYGSDQSASLEPLGMRQLVNQVRKIPICLGSSEVKILEAEREMSKKLRYWSFK